MKKFRPVSALVLNLFVFLSTLYSVICCFIGERGFGLLGVSAFRYFTVDSNILAALSCLPVLWMCLLALTGREKEVPQWISLLKLVGTAAVTVTFLTVLFFLGPLMGYLDMAEGNNIFLHFLNPVAMLISCIFLDGGELLGRKKWLWGVLPVLVYGCLYAVMVLLVRPENGGWEDFYCFNGNGLWPISMAVMFSAGALISLMIALGYNRARKGESR